MASRQLDEADWPTAVVASSDEAIYSPDLEGVIVPWNPAAVRLYGYTADAAIGRPITMTLPRERHTEEATSCPALHRGAAWIDKSAVNTNYP